MKKCSKILTLMIALLAFNTFTASAANDPSGKCMLGYLK